MNNDEAHIIRRILAGETSLYGRLIDRYGTQVFTLAVRITGNREDAEELTQDIFLKAFGSLAAFRGECAFSTWLYRIASNAVLSAARRRARQAPVVADSELVASLSDREVDEALADESEEQVNRLRRALDRLAPDERALVSLFYEEERPVAEVAYVMGLTEGNVKVKLHRVRKKLYLLIKQEE